MNNLVSVDRATLAFLVTEVIVESPNKFLMFVDDLSMNTILNTLLEELEIPHLVLLSEKASETSEHKDFFKRCLNQTLNLKKLDQMGRIKLFLTHVQAFLIKEYRESIHKRADATLPEPASIEVLKEFKNLLGIKKFSIEESEAQRIIDELSKEEIDGSSKRSWSKWNDHFGVIDFDKCVPRPESVFKGFIEIAVSGPKKVRA